MKAHTPGRLGSAGVVLTALAALAAPALAASPPAGASTPPANAPSLQQRKAQANQQRQAAQAQLDLARANDDQVQAEVTRLDAAVVSEATKVAGADQALDTAKREVRSAQAAVNALRARTDRARRSLTAVAVSGYMSPPAEDAVTQILTAADLQQAARRQAFLVNVQATTTEVIDALRQAQQDETAAAERLQQVQSTAQARARAEEATQLELRAQQVAQAAAHSELQKRIAELLGETQAYAAQESQLEALITAAQAAARSVTGPVSNIGLIWPVHGPVTSEFGPRWGGFHPGIDIGAGYGAPIHAAKAGTVIFAGYYGGYGNFVVIDHGGAVATAYAHQSRIAVSQGQTVQQGQVIGYIGSTGYSTGPHLHFEVRINGVAQNPRRYEVGNP